VRDKLNFALVAVDRRKTATTVASSIIDKDKLEQDVVLLQRHELGPQNDEKVLKCALLSDPLPVHLPTDLEREWV